MAVLGFTEADASDPAALLVVGAVTEQVQAHRERERRALAHQIISALAEAMK